MRNSVGGIREVGRNGHVSGCQVGPGSDLRGGRAGFRGWGSGKLGVTDTCQVVRLVRVGPPGGTCGISWVGSGSQAVTDTCQVVRLGSLAGSALQRSRGGRAELCVCILPIQLYLPLFYSYLPLFHPYFTLISPYIYPYDVRTFMFHHTYITRTDAQPAQPEMWPLRVDLNFELNLTTPTWNSACPPWRAEPAQPGNLACVRYTFDLTLTQLN